MWKFMKPRKCVINLLFIDSSVLDPTRLKLWCTYSRVHVNDEENEVNGDH